MEWWSPVRLREEVARVGRVQMVLWWCGEGCSGVAAGCCCCGAIGMVVVMSDRVGAILLPLLLMCAQNVKKSGLEYVNVLSS